MWINALYWNLFLKGCEYPSLTRFPVYAGTPRFRLLTYICPTTPEGGRNILLLCGDHSKERILRHLLLRFFLETPSKPERELTRVLGAISSEWLFHLSEFILEYETQIGKSHRWNVLLRDCQTFPRLGLRNPKRILGSYRPRIRILRSWLPPKKRVILPSTMGVGYKDKGSLSPQGQLDWTPVPGMESQDSSLDEFRAMLETHIIALQSYSDNLVRQSGYRRTEERQKHETTERSS